MGGIGSGWFGRRTYRATTADYPSIDVRELQRTGILTPGNHLTLTIRAGDRWQMRRRACQELAVAVESDQVTLGYTRVRLMRTKATLGGFRVWFRCPRCFRRSCILYCASARGGFGCRVCLCLAYPVEREAPRRRQLRRAWKIIGQVGVKSPPDPRRKLGKPKWQRWRTFWRLDAEAEKAGEVLACAEQQLYQPLLLPVIAT